MVRISLLATVIIIPRTHKTFSGEYRTASKIQVHKHPSLIMSKTNVFIIS